MNNPKQSKTAPSSNERSRRRGLFKNLFWIGVSIVLAVMLIGSLRNENFWQTPDQRGDRLLKAGEFADAAKAYTDPVRTGTAQYRDGQFEAAAKTFARVNTAEGAFNQGNSWLMRGKYEDAIASYDRALGMKPDWPEAMENKSIALARKAELDRAAEKRTDQGTEIGADEIVFDQKGDNKKGKPEELSAGDEMSDAELRALWLRQVKTTPGDFLRAKFAYQSARAKASASPNEAPNSKGNSQ